MTHRDRFIAALEHRAPAGRVPHFEMVFFLTMEAFGKVHPLHRRYDQWQQMEEQERERHRKDMAGVYLATARRFEHDAILLHPNPGDEDESMRLLDTMRDQCGDKYFLMIPGDGTFQVPDGRHIEAFSYRLVDDPAGLKAEAAAAVDGALARIERLRKHGTLDGIMLYNDYCLNEGPFLSPNQFGEFVTPYLARLIEGYRQMGLYTIKHTDGNIMPILDQLIQARPHAMHSLDPQGKVDIAEVKRLYGREVCLIGNVNCGLLDAGTDEQVVESARYALRHGMPGGGYVFSTSNCIYTGMRLARYELMLDIWRKEGNYPGPRGEP